MGIEKVLRDGFRFDRFYEEVIYPTHEIIVEEEYDLGLDANGTKILAEYDIAHNRVLVDEVIGPHRGDSRRTFTLWHEVGGHAILQGPWLREQLQSHKGPAVLTTSELSIEPDVRAKLERQANLFAAHAAAPDLLVIAAFAQAFWPIRKPFMYVGPSDYCVTVAGSTRRNYVHSFEDYCRLLAYYVRRPFDGLSIEALSYRIAESPLVENRCASSSRLHATERKRSNTGPLPLRELVYDCLLQQIDAAEPVAQT